MNATAATTLCNSSSSSSSSVAFSKPYNNSFPSSSSSICPPTYLSPTRNLNLLPSSLRTPTPTTKKQQQQQQDDEDDEEEETSSSTSSNSLSRRRLILLRHAESSWADRSLRDHVRPLSKAGRTDAVNVSSKLQQLGWVPELILSSDATRTRETLKIMQEQVSVFLEAEVHFISSFYSIAAMDGQTADHIQQAICQYSTDQIFTVMCMGHNRGWEEAASMLSGTTIELKTCNAALLESSGKSWNEAFALAGLGGWKLHGIVKPN